MWVQNSCKNLAANISEGEKKKLFIAKLRSKYKSSIHYKRLVWVSKAYSFVTTLMSVQKNEIRCFAQEKQEFELVLMLPVLSQSLPVAAGFFVLILWVG